MMVMRFLTLRELKKVNINSEVFHRTSDPSDIFVQSQRQKLHPQTSLPQAPEAIHCMALGFLMYPTVKLKVFSADDINPFRLSCMLFKPMIESKITGSDPTE